MTRVKICGIREVTDALAAAAAGADLIGTVFAPSKRQVSAERAREIALALEGLQAPPKFVGVFVNMPADEVNRIAAHCKLDLVQLSGDEPWGFVRAIQKDVIKVIRVGGRQSAQEVIAQIQAGEKAVGAKVVCLLDCHVEGSYGGSGRTFDWTVARQVGQRHPVIVAGGLSPENVREAIRVAAPWGVDVSTGVETNGVKDVSRIKSFIREVRAAEHHVDLGE